MAKSRKYISYKKEVSLYKKDVPRLTRKELKQKAVDFMGGQCESCGYSKCLAALTFHHKNPEEKDFGISHLMNIISWQDLIKELEKCAILCCNCHTEVHNGILDGYSEI